MENQYKTLLIIDDDERTCLMLTRMFNALGYSTHEATNGEQALKIMSDFRVDCILLDLVMPELSGFDMLCLLKTYTGPTPIPIIMMTANIDPKVRGQAFSAGVDHFLTKPFSIDELENIINAVTQAQTKPGKIKLIQSFAPAN